MKFDDNSTRDNNRRPLNLHRPEVEKLLPSYFQRDYPNLIKLLNEYYDWMDSDGQPSRQIRDMYKSRDATQVPDDLLQFLEDELLLGQAYFGGFLNKREAIKFSNLLFRSKGTKYSIQQFFRGFFGTDPDIIYPKENIFKVGPQIDYNLDSNNDAGGQIKEAASTIGPESLKYITDDKLYQVLSILIKTDIPFNDWRDVYKLFVHPAGVYIGSQIQIVSANEVGLPTEQDDYGDPIETTVKVLSEAELDITARDDITFLNQIDHDADGRVRQITNQMFAAYKDLTLEQLGQGYNYGSFLSPNSPTFDANSQDSDLTFSDSAYADAGIYEDALIKSPTFDLHVYDTEYDSAT